MRFPNRTSTWLAPVFDGCAELLLMLGEDEADLSTAQALEVEVAA
jgi:hypothetical protein